MSLTVSSSGTVTTDGTEQTLATPATSNVYAVDIDTANMADGDIIEIRMKKKVLTGGTVRTVWQLSAGPAKRSELIVSSPPTLCPFGCTVTVKRVAGTDRAYDWSIMALQ